MEDVMLDLETLGQAPGCAILSIGAIAFSPEHGTGRHFYEVVNTRSCCDRYGLTKDPGTMKWWDGQDSEARKVLAEAEASKVGLADALLRFTAFCKHFNGNNLRIWGNGSDFDNAIIAHCYGVTGQPLPWRFWNSRCFRTLRHLAGDTKRGKVARHNALQDAVDQANVAIELMKRIRVNA